MLEQKNTRVYTVRNRQQAGKIIQRTAEVIREGGLVCFPTETVYGLGADATNDKAVADIFRAKNRSFENPVALHLHSVDEIEKYVRNIQKKAYLLMEKFLPGPLMLIFEKNDNVSDIVTGGLRKVGIRVPRHDLCLEFLKECGTPVAATSANKSGRLSCVKAEDILEELGGKIDVLLDVGTTPLGIESTVLDMTSDPPRIIRPGFITMEEIAVTIGIPPFFSDNVVKSSSDEPRSEIETRMILLEGAAPDVIRKIQSYLKVYKDKKIAVVTTDETAALLKEEKNFFKMGSRENPAEVARKIFGILRDIEKKNLELIIVEGLPRVGLGRTLMIRLRRMAEEVIKIVNGNGGEETEKEEEMS